MTTPAQLAQLILTSTPILPWAAACAAGMWLERYSGAGVTWAQRRDNIAIGIGVIASMTAGQILIGVTIAAIRHFAHTGQAPVDLNAHGQLIGALAWIAVYDGLYYLFHRLEHRVTWLWRIHALHHSDTAMNTTTYLRQHVAESLLQSALILLPMLLVFRLSPSSAGIVAIVSAAVQFWIHSDVPVHYGQLSAALVSPLQHRWHHSRNAQIGAVNLAGIFPWFDVLGGTYKAPASGDQVETGLY